MADLHKFRYRLVITLLLTVIAHFDSPSQNEYLGILNYTTLSLNRLNNIPGVTWINSQSTYDQNHQRFFFMGSGQPGSPFQFFTIDAVSGSVIYNPIYPNGNMTGNIGGFQYDQGTDTLYVLHSSLAGTTALSWIDPPTAQVHDILTIPNFLGYQETSFDTKNHLFIINNGGSIMAINPSSGAIVFNWRNVTMNNMVYDNLNGKLYGINYSNSLPYPQFDSVSLTTGIEYPIANLPAMYYLQIYDYAIDEHAGKFIVVSTNPSSPECFVTSIYVLDIQTGAILSQSLYPYAQNTSNPTDENLIEYSFDNQRGKLYGLNWHPPNSSVTIFSITDSPVTPCLGSMLTFTAQPGTSAVNPSYQWQVNGVNVGTNSTIYLNNNLVSGDILRCILTNNSPCFSSPPDTSNSISIQFSQPVSATVSIEASSTTNCASGAIKFTAHVSNGGSTAIYQWMLNGNPVGISDSIYSSNSLINGDSIRCIISLSSNCVLPGPDSSNFVVIQINSANSSVTIRSSTNPICSGDTAVIMATTLNGGNSPNYQWQVNGTPVGTNSDSLITSSLSDGDVVSCILYSNIPCATSVPSTDSIVMIVNSSPALNFTPDTLILKPGESAQLNPVVSGLITSYQWVSANNLSNPFIAQPIANPDTTTTYQLTIVANNGCLASGKITLVVYHPFEMPNAFSPNGDGKNDLFRIPPSTPQKIISFAVFNRWGQLVFRTTNSSSGWDGNLSGQPQPVDTYVWMIEYENLLTNQRAFAKGTVILIR